MATGGEVPGAKVRQSDAVHEYTCSTCSQNDVTTEATHYCPECDVCYCKACLCEHAVLGRAKIAQWDKTHAACARDQPRGDVEEEVTCLRHPGHAVTLYCVDHEALCCQLCASADHRACSNVKALSATVTRPIVDELVVKAKAEIANLERNTAILNDDTAIKTAFVEHSHAVYIRQLGEIEEKVISKFKEIRKDALVSKQHYIDKLTADTLVCRNITEDIARVKINMNKSHDDQTRFVLVKRIRELVGEKTRVVKYILNATDTCLFKGIHDADEAKVLECIAAEVGVRMARDEMSQMARFSVETMDDKRECEIVGICQIANGNIVLTDKANNCLKQLDTAYSIINQYNLQASPRGMCVAGDFEVAIMMESRKILIVSVGKSFKNVRTLELDHSCANVAYHNEQLYVTYTPSCCSGSWCYCKTDIHIHDKSGKALGQMTADIGQHKRSGHDNGTPLCISEDGEKIYVALCGGLVVLDSQGRKITSSTEYRNIVGLLVDCKGYVYVSRGGSSEVLKLSQEGTGGFKRVNTVTSPLDETIATGVICYDKRLGRIVICPEKGNYICLEKLAY